MNIIERGKAFVEALRALASRTAWEWRRCPYCGDTLTCKWGRYPRRPWTLSGRQAVAVQRHRCRGCRRTYSEQSALLVRGSWYAREVRRCAVDHWQHTGSSLRRTAEWLRSWLGHQERWQLWRPLEPEPAPAARCALSASTVQRWLDRAGQVAQQSVAGQLAEVPSSGQVGTDGLWARLRGGQKRVVLLVTDCVTGLIWPPVVVAGEATAAGWAAVFARAQAAGLVLADLQGVVSDGASGLVGYLERTLYWVNHQRCVFHRWRHLTGALATGLAPATNGLVGAAAHAVRRQTRRVLIGLVRAVFDAPQWSAVPPALQTLSHHPLGAGLATTVRPGLDACFVHHLPFNAGLHRVSPEWCWRDFRLRLSRGRNHATAGRLERAALLWAVYHNFEPAQWRSERKRRYRYPGQCPLAVAGLPPNAISYLDAVHV